MPSTTFYNLKYSKQEELLHLAMALFAEHDYDDLSVRSLSKEMGITTGAFYRYFGSKEEFFIFMCDYTLEQFWVRQRQIQEELERHVDVKEVLEYDKLQDGFWKHFYRSSLDIRMKYYFRTKDNPLYQRKLEVVSELQNAETYTKEEKEVVAFVVSVLQYAVTSFNYLERRNFDDDAMYNFVNDMILRGFEVGKNGAQHIGGEIESPILANIEKTE